ncbi:MAG TPA: FimV/HubP family polar landmark protein, partial [Mariprofundaceae bacterium]|nr:FimV/HubP family polar landmark protein [Mariprofundaceae bacterium]
MHYRIMLSFYGLIFAIAAFATSASAVSLGKIDVASHLGEPFYAEVPLSLDEGEVISALYVELATPADYRILEVYRDQALNVIRADVENDSRGTRIELTSRSAMDAPFFNLVLKVRQGRATHYKKYPVFLDLPRAAQPAKQAAPLPTLSVEDAAQAPSVTAITPVQPTVEEMVAPEEAVSPVSSFQPYDGWARTSHYGPMVYGDTISTVADRLRVDSRYSRNQVMVALFEKNRSKFDQDNINLIQAGTHLDIPLAEEVERIRPEQASAIMKEHNQRWRELVK